MNFLQKQTIKQKTTTLNDLLTNFLSSSAYQITEMDLVYYRETINLQIHSSRNNKINSTF